MSHLIFPKRWGRQKPSIGSRINWGDPLAIGLSHFVPFIEGGGPARDLATNSYPSGSHTWKNTQGGLGGSFDGSANGLTITTSSYNGIYTIAGLAVPLNTTGTKNIASGSDGSSYSWQLRRNGAAWEYYQYTGTDTGIIESSAVVAGKPTLMAGVWNGSNGFLFRDGRQVGTTAMATFNRAMVSLLIGHNPSVAQRWDGEIVWVGFWKRVLSARELEQLLIEPFSLFVPQSPIRRFWFSASLNQSILPGGITSLEAFGSHVISPGAVSVAPSAIDSGEAFGAHTLSSLVTLLPSAIDSAEAFGSHVLTTLFTISPSGIASLEAFGDHTVSPGTATVSPNGITSEEAFGTALIALYITPTGISSGEALGDPTVSPGAVSIAPNGIGSAEAFGDAVLSSGIVISPNGVASAEAFGNPTLTPGSVLVVPVSIDSLEAFGDAIVSAGGSIISPESIASGESFGVHTLAPGAVSISPTGIGSGEAFGNPSLNIFINPDAIGTAESFGSPTISQMIVISPEGVASLEAFGNPSLATGAVIIQPTGISSGEAFGLLIITAAGQAFLVIDDRTFSVSWVDDRTFSLASLGMTKIGVKIKNIVIGDDRQIKRTYEDLPTGNVISKAWLTVKKKEKDLDSSALIQKSITASAGADGIISDADTTGGNVVIVFELTDEDTGRAKTGIDYFYDIQVKTTSGGLHTLEKGTISFIRQITQATT